jgi:hypothetical protein
VSLTIILLARFARLTPALNVLLAALTAIFQPLTSTKRAFMVRYDASLKNQHTFRSVSPQTRASILHTRLDLLLDYQEI